jgi:hypothetical protein
VNPASPGDRYSTSALPSWSHLASQGSSTSKLVHQCSTGPPSHFGDALLRQPDKVGFLQIPVRAKFLSDVSSRFFADFLDALERRSFDVSALLDGLPIDRSRLLAALESIAARSLDFVPQYGETFLKAEVANLSGRDTLSGDSLLHLHASVEDLRIAYARRASECDFLRVSDRLSDLNASPQSRTMGNQPGVFIIDRRRRTPDGRLLTLLSI